MNPPVHKNGVFLDTPFFMGCYDAI